MTVLVDEARWVWQGLRWAHLVSDHSREELHEFARRLGKRRVGFQGDHYDVDEVDRTRAIALGAAPTGSRDLVRRLRDSGLRDRTAKPRWERLETWEIGVEIPAGGFGPGVGSGEGAAIRSHLSGLAVDTRAAHAVLLADPREVVLLLDLAPGMPAVDSAGPAVIAGEPRPDGWRSVEIFVARRAGLVRPEAGPR